MSALWLPGMLFREPQPIGMFKSHDPQSGYYNDLRNVARRYGSPGYAVAALRHMTVEVSPRTRFRLRNLALAHGSCEKLMRAG